MVASYISILKQMLAYQKSTAQYKGLLSPFRNTWLIKGFYFSQHSPSARSSSFPLPLFLHYLHNLTVFAGIYESRVIGKYMFYEKLM